MERLKACRDANKIVCSYHKKGEPCSGCADITNATNVLIQECRPKSGSLEGVIINMKHVALLMEDFRKNGAIKFHQWMIEEGWTFLRVTDKEAAYVNAFQHEILIHASEYHNRKMITEHGKQIEELYEMFCASAGNGL